MTVLIRPATAADADAIAGVHTESWRDAYRGMLSDRYLDVDIVPERLALWRQRFATPGAAQRAAVAEVDGRIAGFACAYLDEDPEWGTLLDNLHVLAPYRRGGTGARLMAAIARWCLADAKAPRLHLWVLENNVNARRFYDRVGGKNSGRGVWAPPDGTPLPKLLYTWGTPADLLAWA